MKVYVDEMPKCCAECEHCTFNHTKNNGRPFCLIARMPLYNGEEINKDRGQHKDSLSDFDCPLQQLPKVNDNSKKLTKSYQNMWEKLKENLKDWAINTAHIEIRCGIKMILDKMQELEKEQNE